MKGDSVMIAASLVLLILSGTAAAKAADPAPVPYRLSVTTDAVLLSLGSAISGAAVYLTASRPRPGRWEVISARESRVCPFDRTAAGMQLRGADTASAVLAGAVAAAPLFLQLSYLPGNGKRGALTLFVMYAEAMILDIGINNMVRGLVYRKRPCLYDANILDREPRDRESSMSFYSMHASIAFCSAVFLGTVFSDIYRDSLFQYLVWAGALSAAGVTGCLRVASGRHFPTDVIAGAVAGSMIGCIVPLLHRVPGGSVSISLTAGAGTGLAVTMKF